MAASKFAVSYKHPGYQKTNPISVKVTGVLVESFASFEDKFFKKKTNMGKKRFYLANGQ